MFSKFELAIIEADTNHILKYFSLDDKQRKTRENIVEKISSDNRQSDVIKLSAEKCSGCKKWDNCPGCVGGHNYEPA